EAQGALAATYTLGYRLALLVSGALALFLADQMSWTRVYQLMAMILLLVMLVTVIAREPQHAAPRRLALGALLREGVLGPFRDFFARFAGPLGVALLLFIGLLKVPDQMLGVMALPFY